MGKLWAKYLVLQDYLRNKSYHIQLHHNIYMKLYIHKNQRLLLGDLIEKSCDVKPQVLNQSLAQLLKITTEFNWGYVFCYPNNINRMVFPMSDEHYIAFRVCFISSNTC